MIEKAPTSKPVNVEDCMLYLITCNHNNKNDWRLPSQDETRQYRLPMGWTASANTIYWQDHWFKNQQVYQVTPVRTKDD